MNISDLLCDLYDIRRMAELEGFGNLPKDNDGTETTICLLYTSDAADDP